ncbi:uncharacterized protein PV07_02902 [Cladophialophora immunda]|uniref:Uncharacterized protein n=1 Tax=Cladophialophora immunda TaxID=569365 RepID=A0A0D2CJB7_9EURO|nr:uncharacterized protein PV07_02902 [Cladophialophora immunda]KIW31238.1 hypothetical protein PV07_02902 [Cladophialophora immunda]OQV05427.1 hypothetical protein CLAIMM_10170 isoform 3 [Cladophialophora immunda]OQV05428.1 hypothetical protein CLAIMM_10170 isoform 4 [Cladophialophora immunda]
MSTWEKTRRPLTDDSPSKTVFSHAVEGTPQVLALADSTHCHHFEKKRPPIPRPARRQVHFNKSVLSESTFAARLDRKRVIRPICVGRLGKPVDGQSATQQALHSKTDTKQRTTDRSVPRRGKDSGSAHLARSSEWYVNKEPTRGLTAAKYLGSQTICNTPRDAQACELQQPSWL